MDYAYFPGCSLESTGIEFHMSAKARPAASAIAILRAGKAKEIQWPLECALLAPQQFQSGISIKLIPSACATAFADI